MCVFFLANDSNWQWSRGEAQTNESELQDVEAGETSRMVQSLVSDRIEKELIQSQSQSQQSRVKSQWEKVLTGDAKAFLEQVHYEAEQSRSTLTGAANTSFKSTKDERRELLRLKKLQRMGLSEDSSSL